MSEREEWFDSTLMNLTNPASKRQHNQDGQWLIRSINSNLYQNLRWKSFLIQVELLIIDVEGVDFEVLKGLNLKIYQLEIFA